MPAIQHRSYLLLPILAALLTLAACSNNEITANHVHSDLAALDLEGVLVVAMTQRQKARVKFEDDLTRSLRRYGVRAVASHTVVPQDDPNAEDIIAAADSIDAGTILIMRYIEQPSEHINQPSKIYYDVAPEYGVSHYKHFEGYYGHAHTVAYQQPVWTSNVTHRLVLDLYLVRTRDHLWQAVSETLQAGSSEQVRDDAIRSLVGNLKEQGLVH